MINKCKKCYEIVRMNKLVTIIILLLILAFVMLYFNRSNIKDAKVKELLDIVEKFDNAKDKIEYNGKIFIPYKNEQLVTAKIYSKKSCLECVRNIKIIKKSLKEAIPSLKKIEVIFDKKDFISVVEYPLSIVFSENVKNTMFFKDARQFLYKIDEGYGFYAHALDLEINTFKSIPKGGLIGIESSDAKNSLILFISPDCAECSTMNDVMTVIENKYGKKIRTSYVVTSDKKVKLNEISKAIHCASEQNKGLNYLNRVLNSQGTLVKLNSVDKILYNYNIKLGINISKYKTCVKSNKTSKFLLTQEHEFDKFGVTKVPTLFINNKKFEGVITISDIEKELKK